jgi:preprotein translocase subunit Sec61beta
MSTKQNVHLYLTLASGRFFSEDSSNIRIQSKTVLIISLIYIALVVLLHIYAKIGAPAVATEVTEVPMKPTEEDKEENDNL